MKVFIYLSLLFIILSSSGCTGSSQDDLGQWIIEERNQTRPKVNPIPAPKQFVPEVYAGSPDVEPFSSQKLTQALKRDSGQATANAGLVAPELLRRKEPLEAFPIDTMSLVGSIIRSGQPVALMKVDGLLYQVRVGNYLGQNYGRVIKITETEVVLREIIQDAIGEWTERVATLQLQEGSK